MLTAQVIPLLHSFIPDLHRESVFSAVAMSLEKVNFLFQMDGKKGEQANRKYCGGGSGDHVFPAAFSSNCSAYELHG
jgi:hypothetical protein